MAGEDTETTGRSATEGMGAFELLWYYTVGCLFRALGAFFSFLAVLFKPLTDSYLGRMIADSPGWTFNWVMSMILFFVYGLSAAINHGYTDSSKNDDGGIPSGPSGSGVFLVSTMLFCMSTIIWTSKLVTFKMPESA